MRLKGLGFIWGRLLKDFGFRGGPVGGFANARV